MLTLGFKVDLMRFFWGSVITKPLRFAVNSDAGTPFVLKPNNTKKTRLVSSIWPLNVLRIAISRNHSQITQPVVIFATIDMVNQPVWPRTIRVKPRQSMRFVNFLFDAYRNVSKFVGITCNVADVNRFSGTNFPSKNPCCFVVRQKFTKFIGGKVGLHMQILFSAVNVNSEIIA